MDGSHPIVLPQNHGLGFFCSSSLIDMEPNSLTHEIRPVSGLKARKNNAKPRFTAPGGTVTRIELKDQSKYECLFP